jgi:hypothetical protein
MSCQRDVMLMLLYTEIQTVIFGCMSTNNALLLNKVGVRTYALLE